MLSGGFADRTGHPLAVLPLTDVAYSLRVNILLASQVWNLCGFAAQIMRAVEVQLLNQKSVSFFDYRVRKNISAKRIVMTQVPALTSLILPVKILMKT